jgi:ribosomal protein L40E
MPPSSSEPASALVPTTYSLTCRKCSSIVTYDEVPADEAVKCEQCGTINLHPEQER